MSSALGDKIDILRFQLAGHPFALRLADVREIVRAVAPSPLPDAPVSVIGAVDVRGARVPLYDLRARLGLPGATLRARDTLILVGEGARRAAIIADEVQGIEQIPRSAIAPPELRFMTPALLAGVITLAEGTRLLFDLEAFLTEAEHAILAVAMGALDASGDPGHPPATQPA